MKTICIDSDRNLLAVGNELIYLSVIQNIIMTYVIEGTSVPNLLKALEPYNIRTYNLYQHLYTLNKKLNSENLYINRRHYKLELRQFK